MNTKPQVTVDALIFTIQEDQLKIALIKRGIEPFKGYHFHKGLIYGREKLKVTWLAHGNGLVSIDARDEYELTRGDKVEVGISNKPLRVIVP